ncbi:MAG: SpoIIE family protein phosphatase [Campylobacterota bacterium]|nr:SpoIIE family protein phosphatase [Campylobacterota bacterium]
MNADKKNIYKESSELFNFTAKTITFIDFIYIIIFYFTAQNHWLSMILVLTFPLLNVPAIKLSVLHNKNYIDYTLPLTLIPLFTIGYIAGADAPGWLPAFSLLAAIEILVLNAKYKIFLKFSVFFVTAFASFKAGKDIESIIIILLILVIFALLVSSILTYVVSLLNSLKKSKKDLNKQLRVVKMGERKQNELMKVLNIAKKEVEAMHKHTRESIEYASMIQGALLPDENLMKNYFKDYFVHWEPKDTVGGDIWLFSELRDKDECLLFFIDCTGHGVPGAFVTMIVKAVEREIITNLQKHPEFDISPAKVMRHFNKAMKVLLKQETKESKSNAGWDGGVIYYSKKDKILKFAGAETPLFYVDADGTFNSVKGNRYSVGYKKCDMDYEYKETIIKVHDGQKFYCTTDGYLDQNGGEKDFPFGKKRFGNIIKEIHTKPMSEQKKIFIDEMQMYESVIKNSDRNDDMTLISFTI